MKPPYRCVYCGMPSWKHPGEQDMPPDYCHPEDHGSYEDYAAEEEEQEQ